MFIKQAIKILGISKPTIYKLAKFGHIKSTQNPINKFWNFDDEDVFRIANKMEIRYVCLYARVSTHKQKKDLSNQISKLETFANSQGQIVNHSFSDIASGINFEKRDGFFKLLDLIIQGKVSKVVITHKDRLSRIGFDLFRYLFKQFACEIIVMSEIGSTKTDSQEIFEDIISLLHCYSMKMYSQRRGNKIEIETPLEDE